jgi:CBS domain-containing protein
MPTKPNPFIASLSNLKQTDPVNAQADAPYGEVLKVLQEQQTGSIMICEGKKVVGIFTERDIMNKCLLEHVEPETPIRELMTGDPICISPKATIGEAIGLMHQKHIRNLPMTDENGELVGLLTVGRLIRYLASQFPAAVVNLPPKPHQVTEDAEGA